MSRQRSLSVTRNVESQADAVTPLTVCKGHALHKGQTLTRLAPAQGPGEAAIREHSGRRECGRWSLPQTPAACWPA